MLIFTEFTDTARYLARELKAAGIDEVEQIDGSRKLNRAEVIRAVCTVLQPFQQSRT